MVRVIFVVKKIVAFLRSASTNTVWCATTLIHNYLGYATTVQALFTFFFFLYKFPNFNISKFSLFPNCFFPFELLLVVKTKTSSTVNLVCFVNCETRKLKKAVNRFLLARGSTREVSLHNVFTSAVEVPSEHVETAGRSGLPHHPQSTGTQTPRQPRSPRYSTKTSGTPRA